MSNQIDEFITASVQLTSYRNFLGDLKSMVTHYEGLVETLERDLVYRLTPFQVGERVVNAQSNDQKVYTVTSVEILPSKSKYNPATLLYNLKDETNRRIALPLVDIRKYEA